MLKNSALSSRARKLLTLAVVPVAVALVAAGCGNVTTASQPTKAGFGSLHLKTAPCTGEKCSAIPLRSDLKALPPQVRAQVAQAVAVREAVEDGPASGQLLAGYRIDNALTAPDTVRATMTVTHGCECGDGEVEESTPDVAEVILRRSDQYGSELERLTPSGDATQWIGYVAESPTPSNASAPTFDADFGTDALPLINEVHAAAVTGARSVTFGAARTGYVASTMPVTCTDPDTFNFGNVAADGESAPQSNANCVSEVADEFLKAISGAEGEAQALEIATNFDGAQARENVSSKLVPVRTSLVAPTATTNVTVGTSASILVDLGVALPGEEQRDLTAAVVLNAAGSATLNTTSVHANAGITHNPLSITVAPTAVGPTSVTLTVRADGEVIRTAQVPVNVVAAPGAAAAPKDTKSPFFKFVQPFRTTSATNVLAGLTQKATTSEAGTVTGVLTNALPANGLGGKKKKSMVNVYATGKMVVTKPGVFVFRFSAEPKTAPVIAPRSYARQFPMRLTLTITDKAGNKSLIRRIIYVKIPKA